MSTITFDTYRFVKRLKDAGVPEAQAEAESEALSSAFSEALGSQLASKEDLNGMEKAIKTDISDIKSELKLLRWMTGTLIALCVTILFKIFSH